MPHVVGVVKWVGSKAVRNSTLWSFTIEGNDDFFRCGFAQPKINRGDNVSFSYEVNQYGNQVDAKKITVTDASAYQPTAQSAAGQARHERARVGAEVSSSGRDDYWKKKEENDVVKDVAIQFMACTNTAVSILKLAHDAGVLALGAGAKANKLDTLLNQVYLVRDELFSQSTAARAKAAAGEPVVANAGAEEIDDSDWLEEGK